MPSLTYSTAFSLTSYNVSLTNENEDTQEPEVRESIAMIVQSRAEVEASRVLKAIGFNEQQVHILTRDTSHSHS